MIFLTLLSHSYRPPLVEGNKSPQEYSLYSQLIHPGTKKEEFHEYITFKSDLFIPLHYTTEVLCANHSLNLITQGYGQW